MNHVGSLTSMMGSARLELVAGSPTGAWHVVVLILLPDVSSCEAEMSQLNLIKGAEGSDSSLKL